MAEQNKVKSEAKGFFDAYQVSATNLRTWLVAYGIGAPVLFLCNESLWAALVKANCAKYVGLLFLVGVATQVVLASVNKIVMWYCYCGEDDSVFRKKCVYKVADWVSEQFWIDIILDCTSMVLFVMGTYKVFGALVSG